MLSLPLWGLQGHLEQGQTPGGTCCTGKGDGEGGDQVMRDSEGGWQTADGEGPAQWAGKLWLSSAWPWCEQWDLVPAY